MLTDAEQQGSDLDWFFTNGDIIAFVASGGGKLPHSIANSSENNRVLVSFFRALPTVSEVIVNPDLEGVFGKVANETYLADFLNMAQKGLFSFDKTVLNSFSDTNYHLVAKPANPLKFNDLPLEVKTVLSNSRYNETIGTTINSNSIP